MERTGHDLPRLAFACAGVTLYALAATLWLPHAPFAAAAMAVRLGVAGAVCAVIVATLAPGNLRMVLGAIGR